MKTKKTKSPSITATDALIVSDGPSNATALSPDTRLAAIVGDNNAPPVDHFAAARWNLVRAVRHSNLSFLFGAQAGIELAQFKLAVGHGNYQTQLKKKWPLGIRRAQLLMNDAKLWPKVLIELLNQHPGYAQQFAQFSPGELANYLLKTRAQVDIDGAVCSARRLNKKTQDDNDAKANSYDNGADDFFTNGIPLNETLPYRVIICKSDVSVADALRKFDYREFDEAILIIPARLDRSWADRICEFPLAHVKVQHDGESVKRCLLAYLSDDPDLLRFVNDIVAAFGNLGRVLCPPPF